MVRGKKTKTAALVLTALCLILCLLTSITHFNLSTVGICKDATILARLTYPFFHASILHALLNCWCLLSIIFIYELPLSRLLIAYLIAITFPADTICSLCGYSIDALPSFLTTPTVGLSSVIFALFGQIAFLVQRKLYFQGWMLFFISTGFILPPLCSACGIPVATPNNLIHIHCYVVGLIVGFINSHLPHHAH